MGQTSDLTMTDAPDAFAPLAERPPFDDEQGDELDDMDGPTQPVAEVLAFAAEMGLSAVDLVELAMASVEAVTGELFAMVEAEEADFTPETAATIERLQIASQILADVSLFGDEEDDDGPNTEAGEVVEVEWEGEEEAEAA
jgi:hypothetical protein